MTIRRRGGRVALFSLSVLMGAAVFATGAAADGLFEEQNTQRWGATYRSFDLAGSDPTLCANACASEEDCQAWTYLRPGVRGPKAVCELKSTVPMSSASPCCVSGVTVGMSEPASRQSAYRRLY